MSAAKPLRSREPRSRLTSKIARPHTTALPVASLLARFADSLLRAAGIRHHQRGKPPRYRPLPTEGTGPRWLSEAREKRPL